MKLYDVENTAQNIVDRGKEPEKKKTLTINFQF